MDDEEKKFVKVWTVATACLCYCYYIASGIPRGMLRLLSLLPVMSLFIILPFNLSSAHLGGITAFLLLWLSNFKLLLFSFDQGPLSPPPTNVFHFISLTCLPIKLRSQHLTNPKPKERPSIKFMPRSALMSIKAMLLATIIYLYRYKQQMHPHLLLALLLLHMYLELEFVLAICAIPASILLGFELEPQFNEPYLSTSLQNFWGRRWNLMVTSILWPTVYFPVRKSCGHVLGPRWGPLPAIVATFLVSGLMHEIIFYQLTRESPTWEITCFFILHGICTAVEVALKKVVPDKCRLPPVVSGLLTAVFVLVTTFGLFVPQLIRNGTHEKILGEISTVLGYFVW